ncbi:MAG: hypothetical protein M3442_09110 [Chloroflexota bacterium]|nr:hypothetical protein [Chloroflexota bacterium]
MSSGRETTTGVLVLAGVSHHTAPVAVRERLAAGSGEGTDGRFPRHAGSQHGDVPPGGAPHLVPGDVDGDGGDRRMAGERPEVAYPPCGVEGVAEDEMQVRSQRGLAG